MDKQKEQVIAKEILDRIRHEFGWSPSGNRREYAELLIARIVKRERDAAYAAGVEDAAKIADAREKHYDLGIAPSIRRLATK